MARPRSWETSLSDRTRKAYIKEGTKKGWSESQVRAYYENPSNNLGVLRRHVTKSGSAVPEHGLKDAQRNPLKYGDYLKKSQPVKTGGTAHSRDYWYNRAVRKMDGLFADRFKYRESVVRHNLQNASTRELQFYSDYASEENLLDLASEQRQGNPLYYHSPSW